MIPATGAGEMKTFSLWGQWPVAPHTVNDLRSSVVEESRRGETLKPRPTAANGLGNRRTIDGIASPARARHLRMPDRFEDGDAPLEMIAVSVSPLQGSFCYADRGSQALRPG